MASALRRGCEFFHHTVDRRNESRAGRARRAFQRHDAENRNHSVSNRVDDHRRCFGRGFHQYSGGVEFFQGRLLQSAVTIAVQPGTYTETVLLRNQPYASLIRFQGDTRTAAGSRTCRRPGAASFNTDGGFKAEDQAVIYAYTSTAKNNATGYLSQWNSLIVADNTNANKFRQYHQLLAGDEWHRGKFLGVDSLVVTVVS
jgi:hypothetical protein